MSEADNQAEANRQESADSLAAQAKSNRQETAAATTALGEQAESNRQETADSLALLAAAVEGLTVQAAEAVDAVNVQDTKAAHDRRRLFRWSMLASAAILALLGLLLAGLYETHVTNQQIASCVTPQGKCYQESRRQTGAVIGQLNKAGNDRRMTIDKTIVAAVACAQTNKGMAAVQACVNKAMSR